MLTRICGQTAVCELPIEKSWFLWLCLAGGHKLGWINIFRLADTECEHVLAILLMQGSWQWQWRGAGVPRKVASVRGLLYCPCKWGNNNSRSDSRSTDLFWAQRLQVWRLSSKWGSSGQMRYIWTCHIFATSFYNSEVQSYVGSQ